MQNIATDLLGAPLRAETTPSSNPSYVAALRQQIARFLSRDDIDQTLALAIPGNFARLEADQHDFVGREILATYVDTDQPEHSCVSVAHWRNGQRTERVVPIHQVKSVVRPLQARYAFDRLDTAEGPQGCRL